MLAVLLALAFSHATPAARAQTLIEEWGTAKFPPPPALKPAKIDAKETALLVMDFTKQTCTPERRKRCSDSVAKVLKLVTEARAKGALIIYRVAVPNSVPADILPELTPAAGEQVLPPLGPDKSGAICLFNVEGIDPVKLGGWLLDRHRIVNTPIVHPEFHGIRITPSVYTSVTEIDTFADAVLQAIKFGIAS